MMRWWRTYVESVDVHLIVVTCFLSVACATLAPLRSAITEVRAAAGLAPVISGISLILCSVPLAPWDRGWRRLGTYILSNYIVATLVVLATWCPRVLIAAVLQLSR